MNSKMLFKGYLEQFIFGHEVPLPKLNLQQTGDLVLDVEGNQVVKYINYSLQLSKSHRFPFYTATNIDGLMFKKVPRRDYWRKDPRLPKESQWGKDLYMADNSNFDRGHMTKREDVQWGETMGIALKAADSTFFYANAVPQHKNLNRTIWRSLEDYILHTEAKQNQLRICVFTGPVLLTSNPTFVTSINNEDIKIPFLFWKVVVFQKEDGNLYRVGFMMSQNKLLIDDNIIEELESEDQRFMQFKDADTYQVNITLIEEITGLALPDAIDSYVDDRTVKLILNEIDIDPDLENDSIEYEIGYSIENIIL